MWKSPWVLIWVPVGLVGWVWVMVTGMSSVGGDPGWVAGWVAVVWSIVRELAERRS